MLETIFLKKLSKWIGGKKCLFGTNVSIFRKQTENIEILIKKWIMHLFLKIFSKKYGRKNLGRIKSPLNCLFLSWNKQNLMIIALLSKHTCYFFMQYLHMLMVSHKEITNIFSSILSPLTEVLSQFQLDNKDLKNVKNER